MKPKSRNPLATALLTAITATAACVHTANAATYYWDGGTVDIGGNGNGISAPSANGVWNTTIKNWDQNGVAYVAWPTTGTHTAVFGGTARTVTASGTLNVGRLEVNTAGYTFNTGTLAFSNGTIDTFGSFTGALTTTFNSTLSGSLVFNATGSTGTSGNFAGVIAGNNTSLTSFEWNGALASNQLSLNHIGALGSAGATVKLTKGLLALSTTGSPTYNAWTTELAGGTIRARVTGINTYSGNGTLTADSSLAVAAVAGASLAYTGTLNLNANTLTLAPSSTSSGIAINNTISGSGNISVNTNANAGVSTTLGTVTLGAANTFSGNATTPHTSGTLALNHVNALQNATLDTGASGGQSVTFIVAGTNTYNIGALQGSDALAIGGNTISVGSKAVDTTFGAAINGTGGVLTKVGDNTLTLSATSGYTGATNVDDGTLLINGNITTSSLTTVASGATLGGIGMVGAVTVQGGGTLAPGASAGTLTSGTVSLANLSNLNFELNPADLTAGGGINDLISVTGNLTLDGILNLTPTSGDFLSAVSGNAWRLFNYTGSLTNNTLALGTMPALGSGLSWNINTATANQVNLVVIPEPSAALLGAIGLLALLRRRR